MANTEAQFRQEIIAACRGIKYAHVFSVSDRFQSGRPDLYIKHPEFPPVWLELKFVRTQGPQDDQRRKTGYPLRLTQLQRKFIADEQKAGGHAGWALCVKEGASAWVVYASSDAEAKRAMKSDMVQCRFKGEPWMMGMLLNQIVESAEDFVNAKSRA